MLHFVQIIILLITTTSIYFMYYKRSDLFTLFIVCKILSILSIIPLIADIYIYNTAGILISILYIVSIKIVKSVIRVMLLITIKNKHSSFFF
jgi:hypothetical protein